jgi:hypothetical protein
MRLNVPETKSREGNEMANLVNTMDLTLQKFESQIPSGGDLDSLWNGFKFCLYNPSIDSQDEAYQIFSTALKITRIVAKLEDMKSLWIELLSKRTFTVCRPDKPPHSYHFHSIVKLAKTGEENFKIDIVEVDRCKDDIAIVAKDIESIAKEAIGDSPGTEFFEGMLKDSNSICMLAKQEDSTVGCLYGTCIHIQRMEKQSINVLHFRFLARKADYPSINFIQLLQKHEKRIFEKFQNLDYLSLCVFVDNSHALQRYHELGFSNIERIEQGFMGNSIFFLRKKLHQGDDLQGPTRAEVRAALDNAKQI